MLLRSVTEHVREQNWTAIVIDFFIVVVGVFIGIQVANWNDELRTQREEALLVARLAVDFERIDQDAQRSLDFHRNMLDDLNTLMRSLRSGAVAADDGSAVSRALLLGLSIQTSSDRSGTFTELLSSGRADILRDKELLNELVAYEDFLERYDVAKDFLMGMLLGLQQPFMGGFEYDFDAPMVDLQLHLGDSRLPSVTYDFDALIADAAFYEAAEQTAFVHSIALLWRTRITDRIARILSNLKAASNAPQDA